MLNFQNGYAKLAKWMHFKRKISTVATRSLKVSASMQFCPIVPHSHRILQCTAGKQLTRSTSAVLLLKAHC